MKKPGRMTISVPNDLKDRMEATGEDVSWSAVACAAFEVKLAEIIKKRGVRDMQDVVTRLRATRAAAEGEQYLKGRTAGEEWAKTHAEADQLERLAEFRETCAGSQYTFEDYFTMEVNAPLDHAGWIAAAIHPPQGPDDPASLAFDMFGENYTDDYVRGFVDAAVEVWEKVKELI